MVSLAGRFSAEFRTFFRPALDKVIKFDVSLLESVLARMPDGWMSPLEQDFVHAFVSHNLDSLKKLRS